VAIRLYVFCMVLVSILSGFLWLILFFSVNPFQAPSWIIFIFYTTFFVFLAAIFSLASFYYKVWASNREVIFSHIGPSIRQACFASLALTTLLFFEQIKVLSWWVASMIILAVILFELFFRSRR